MQLLLLFAQIILFVVTALLVIYLFKRIWHKQRYKPVWTKISFVERRSNLSYDEFIREYASLGKPVIITDIVKNWQASAKWTLDFFRSEYGSSKVSVKDCKSKTHVDMILANYIDYMRSDKPNKFLYLEEFRSLLHPKLCTDYTIPVYFPDWLQRLPQKLLEKYHLDLYLIYLGSKDTSIGLHSDILDTSAWIALISGRKKFVFFTPDQQEFLYNGKVDVFNPDLRKFPLYAKTKPIEVILESGELIYVPSKWWHQVKNLEESISLNCNIINEWNSESVFQFIMKINSMIGFLFPLLLEFPWLGRFLLTTRLL